MKMMGMQELPYWASWLTDYTFKNLLISASCALVLNHTVFKHSDGRLIFALIFLFG